MDYLTVCDKIGCTYYKGDVRQEDRCRLSCVHNIPYCKDYYTPKGSETKEGEMQVNQRTWIALTWINSESGNYTSIVEVPISDEKDIVKTLIYKMIAEEWDNEGEYVANECTVYFFTNEDNVKRLQSIDLEIAHLIWEGIDMQLISIIKATLVARVYKAFADVIIKPKKGE